MLEEEIREEQDGQVPLLGRKDRKKISLFGWSSVTVVLLGLVGMIEYSLIMPNMEKYVVEKLGGDDLFYGMSMAVFSAARVLFMPVLGYWADQKPMIQPFLFSVLLSLLGNVMYSMAEWAQTKWFVFFGRALVGMGAANSTLTMSYITRITTKETRTKALATINGINLLGIVLGPVANVIINFDLETGIKNFSFNQFTNPGWLMFILLGLIWISMSFTFEEPDRIVDVEDEIDAILLAEQGLADDQDVAVMSGRSWKSIYWGLFWHDSLWVHFVISFVSNFLVSELETALPALTYKSYGWGTIENSIMYACIGIVTATALVLTGIYSSIFSDRQFITAGTIIYGVALVTSCFTLDRLRPAYFFFAFCCLLLIIAAPLTDSPNMAAYSKRLSDHREALPYLGLFLGFIDASNGVARTVAPLYAGWALGSEERLRVYIGPTLIWGFSALVLVFRFSKFHVEKKPGLARSFSAVQPVDGSAGPFIQSPLLVTTPNVVLHSALSEFFTPPTSTTSDHSPRFSR